MHIDDSITDTSKSAVFWSYISLQLRDELGEMFRKIQESLSSLKNEIERNLLNFNSKSTMKGCCEAGIRTYDPRFKRKVSCASPSLLKCICTIQKQSMACSTGQLQRSLHTFSEKVHGNRHQAPRTYCETDDQEQKQLSEHTSSVFRNGGRPFDVISFARGNVLWPRSQI